jgi:hypothetical protein
VHIPKFRNGAGKILANASTPDFSGTSDKILGYALIELVFRINKIAYTHARCSLSNKRDCLYPGKMFSLKNLCPLKDSQQCVSGRAIR